MERLTVPNEAKYCRHKKASSPTWEIIERLVELEDKLESGRLVELPCKVGDTVYGVGMFACKDKDVTDKTLKRKIFNECMKRNGKCDGCKYAAPAIEEFVCTQIQIAHDGIWVCGAKAEMHLASKIFTDKAQAEARLKELQEERK